MVSQGRGCPLLSGADQGHFAGYTVMQHGTHCTQWSNKTRWLLREVHSNNNSLHLYFVFHLEVSCYILNLIKAPAASRITDNSQGPSVNPSGVWRAGNRYWLKTLLQNSSYATNHNHVKKRQGMLHESDYRRSFSILSAAGCAGPGSPLGCPSAGQQAGRLQAMHSDSGGTQQATRAPLRPKTCMGKSS